MYKPRALKISPLVLFQICALLKAGTDLHISEISTLTRQTLSHLLDSKDRLGKDWCLLAVRMGLTDKVPKLEGGNRAKGQSQTAKLLDEWERKGKSSSIGQFFNITWVGLSLRKTNYK
jgi:hypothetical protein